ncbi:MAG: sulfite exporter TauE/SafE family protein [Ilumatobacter sp.]|nr:sulfite exporter TauE/SafE family protein [Ilumatobacter sp.]
MSWLDVVLLLAGGLLAGGINSMAGGGSLLTVPLLSLAGVDGLSANGTNRVAVLIQTVMSGVGYHQGGVRPYRETARLAPPALVGGLIGALSVSQLNDDAFEKIFGLLMIPLLVLALWKPKLDRELKPWPRWVQLLVFFGVGFYAGAIQAGVGILLLLLLTRSGYDLVRGNGIKTALVILITAFVALPVFLIDGQVEWYPALVLSAGSAAGGYGGARLAVHGGERLIKPVLVVAVLGLSGKMVGLY